MSKGVLSTARAAMALSTVGAVAAVLLLILNNPLTRTYDEHGHMEGPGAFATAVPRPGDLASVLPEWVTQDAVLDFLGEALRVPRPAR